MNDIDESLEQLLSNASPRPVPAPADTAAVHEAVRAEWRTVSGRRRSRRRLMNYAVAATILVSAFSLFNSFSTPDVDISRVAMLQKSYGSIFVVGEHSTWTQVDDLLEIHPDQKIATGNNSGIALAWASGGSVRLGADTTVEFVDDSSVYLHTGKIYFDSTPSELITGATAANIGSFQIQTNHGVVSHTGTQFMTEVKADELVVSVREGRVSVAGIYYPHMAYPGDQVRFQGSRRPTTLSIDGYGESWDWIGRSSPSIDVHGKSAYQLLRWAGRELGREIAFSSDAVEQELRDAVQKARFDMAPGEALQMLIDTADIDLRYEEGKIYVSNNE